MKLSQIKMSGFKSFVDTTTINISNDRTGVVGPNGCGKSNIIDAVKWVMGDTSKHIRGGSLEDVIFNGTDTRKPNDYAFVELIFSNTENKIGGEFAKYDEISIKREASRDGNSKYFLNNSHCRRRDIIDIFLGTGLGPKSYAIINQGTASKLIESKPEEFRVFIEEVAGISKYRERKKETESKLLDSKSNLDRVEDILKEINKRLFELKKQSEDADKFKKLNEEYEKIRAEVVAISIKNHLDKAERIKIENSKIETQIEKLNSEMLKKSNEIESITNEYDSKNQNYNEIQKKYYELMTEAGKIEKSLEYEQKSEKEKEEQTKNKKESVSSLKNRIQTSNNSLEINNKKLKEYEKDVSVITDQIKLLEKNIDETSKLKNERTEDLNHLINENNKYLNLRESINSKIDDKENQISKISENINDIDKNIKKLELSIKENELNQLDNEIEMFTKDSEKLKEIHNNEVFKSFKITINRLLQYINNISKLSKSIQKKELENIKKNQEIKTDYEEKIKDEQDEINNLNYSLEDLSSKVNEYTEFIENSQIDIENIKKNINDLENLGDKKNYQLKEANKKFYEHTLNIETLKVKNITTESQLSDYKKNLLSLEEELSLLISSDDKSGDRVERIRIDLQQKLKLVKDEESHLEDINTDISSLTEVIERLNDEKFKLNSELEAKQAKLNDGKNSIEVIFGQTTIFNEQLEELGVKFDNILEEDKEYSLSDWKKNEDSLKRRIERMGPINMAAIDEYKEYESRSIYLTEQKNDLLSSINTLESAIKKIDQETNARFQNTFDKINLELSRIFPKLFNGGKAHLKILGNDILTAGVEVYACPPGKKLSSINLLSGGEKALTSISLVFALFSLNPAPFCMLDEIDAPLDDANIDRFCQVLKEMSNNTQFIVITHKKPTMEYVDNLIGVTMGEKGVSKIVDVNLAS